MKKIWIQIFTGGLQGQKQNAQAIIEALTCYADAFAIHGVIMGWCHEPLLYEAVSVFLKERGTKQYLWLPVLSEIGTLVPMMPVIGLDGLPLRNYELKIGESFAFYCPQTPDIVEKVLSAFDQLYPQGGYEGVFLDKIRYPSASVGFEAFGTCLCQRCQADMADQNLPVESIKEALKALVESRDYTQFVSSDAEGNLHYPSEALSLFFAYREKTISALLLQLASHFKERGLEVGLDFFAPFFALPLGQSLDHLLDHVAFIKPMYYRKTFAPAGLPFELSALSPHKTLSELQTWLHDFGYAGSDEVYEDQEMLSSMEEFKKPEKIFFGFEVNAIEGVSQSDANYVRRNLKILEASKVGGVVLSWDLMHFPQGTEQLIKGLLE